MDVRRALKRQYRAALGMLKNAIEACPESLWTEGDHPVAFWRVAYHTLFCTHFYLAADEQVFRPWEHHREEHQFLGPLPWPPHDEPKITQLYTRAQILEYWEFINAMIDKAVDQLDLNAQDSGFPWYNMPKLEHQLVNIRHVQHHAAILANRLRVATGVGVDWLGSA
jgi:hypothetical protein